MRYASFLLLCLWGTGAVAQDAATLEKEVGTKKGSFLARANYQVERTVVLDTKAVVRGKGTERTTTTSNGTHTVFASKDLTAWKNSNTGGWTSSGVPMRIELKGIGVHGTGSLVYDDSWLYQPNQASGPAAIDLWCPGATIDDVDVYDWPGPAILYGRGGETRTGGLQSTDRETARLVGVSVSRCFAGPYLGPSADGVVRDLDVGMARDWGLKVESSGTNVDQIHLWGVGGAPTEGQPDLGAALIDGKSDSSTGANHYGNVQVDNCSHGVVSYVPSDWDKVICQKIERTCFDVHRRCQVSQLVVMDMEDWYGRDGHDRIGLRLRPTSSYCTVTGVIYATNAPNRDNSDAVAAMIDGHAHTVNLVVYAPGATSTVIIGHESAPSGNEINLVVPQGGKVKLENLGTRNTIRVRSVDGYDAIINEELYMNGNVIEVF